MLAVCPKESDIACRFGGEEFILLLPGTILEDTVVMAERIRRVIASTKIQLDNKPISVTASFGVASQSKEIQLSQLIKKADEALYDAKAQGRNRVISLS